MSGATALEETLEAESAIRAPRFWSGRQISGLAVKFLSLAAAVGLWQLASTYHVWFIVNFAFVPAPTDVFEAALAFADSRRAFGDIGNSLFRIFAGFSIATGLAIPLGIAIGSSKWIENILLTPFEILRPIPAVAWIPLAILMFATAEQSMVYICFIGAFYPILLSTIHGVETLDKRLIFASQSLGARPLNTFLEVILPGALPSIITGLSIGMGTCWFSLVTAEMVAGKFGIGYFTWEAYTLQDYPNIVVGMLLIGLLGMASSTLVRRVGESFMPWHRLQTNTPR